MDPLADIYQQSLLTETKIVNPERITDLAIGLLGQWAEGSTVYYDYGDVPNEIVNWVKTKLVKYLSTREHYLPTHEYRVKPDDPDWMQGRTDLLIMPSTHSRDLVNQFRRATHAYDEIMHIFDWMASLDDRGLKKLDRITVQQAREHADRWVEEINRKANNKEDWSNVETVMEWPNGFKIVSIQGDVCLEREGKLMGHCVGGGGYKDAGIYSLRDKNNEPHATLEVRDGNVLQIQGKQNTPPIKKYHSYIRQFITKSGLNVTRGGDNIGMVSWDNLWYDPDSEEWEELYETEIIPYQDKVIQDILSAVKGGVIDNSVNLDRLYLKELPDLSNVEVNGGFSVARNLLTTLKGAPKKIRGSFDCNYNQLKTLEGGPKYVGNQYRCHNNKLTSLHGAPEYIGGSLICSNNQLKTLEGSPEEIGEELYCAHNQLTTLEGGPKKVESFYGGSNPLKSLKGAPLVSDIFESDQFSHSDYLEYMKSLNEESFEQFYYKYV